MTAKKPKVTVVHGDTLRDDYFWLREKSNPEVPAHLKAKNAYTAAMMASTAGLQDLLFREMVGHIKETGTTAAYRWGDALYYSRPEQGKQYPILCRQAGSFDAPEDGSGWMCSISRRTRQEPRAIATSWCAAKESNLQPTD